MNICSRDARPVVVFLQQSDTGCTGSEQVLERLPGKKDAGAQFSRAADLCLES
jgi:hypothetical protein